MDDKAADDAGRRYNADREDHKATFQLSGEYAKWFISTLLLLNSGAIAGILQKGAGAKYAILIHGVGIMLALGAGFFGWRNLQFASQYYRRSAEEHYARPRPEFPTEISDARWWAVRLSISSGIFLLVGGILIWFQL